MGITPGQCRAARALLDITRDELAELSGVSTRALAYFEEGERVPVPQNMAAIRRALEAAGVDFIAENGGGPGARLRKSKTRPGRRPKR
jgi:transcriptional regulator with XRE-family HTH domain